MMGNFEVLGKWIVVGGLAITIVGSIIWLLGKMGITQFPGTIRINFAGGQCVIPLLAMIVFSILLTLILNFVIRLLR